MKIRRSEIVLLAYTAYMTLLAFARPTAGAVRWRMVAVNLAFWGLIALAARQNWETLRDWLPYPAVLLAYKEVGWLALPHASTALEQGWVVWDRLLLRDWGLRAAIESLGPVLPNVLELSYLLVYGVPAYAAGLLFWGGARERMDAFYVVLLLSTLGAYALYPFFPSEPPRAVFPGEDMPSFMTLMRRVNLYFVNGYGIHTSVFPSGHVAAAFGAAFGVAWVLPKRRKQAVGLIVLAVLIAVATVYGRYHYAVDALAGFAVAVGALAMSRFWLGPRAWSPRT